MNEPTDTDLWVPLGPDLERRERDYPTLILQDPPSGRRKNTDADDPWVDLGDGD